MRKHEHVSENGAVLNLYDTTTIWMSWQCHDLIIKSWNHKLDGIFRYTFNTLLDDMVPILITNTTHNMAIQFTYHFCLLVQLNNFYSLNSKMDAHENRVQCNMMDICTRQWCTISFTFSPKTTGKKKLHNYGSNVFLSTYTIYIY